jgi:hypothetical protein
MAWPSVYTYNFCSNPSFEQDLTGVTGVNGVVPVLNMGTGLYGTQSLQVTAPGQNPNEGVILPPGTVLASATGCVSFYLQGSDIDQSGTLNVYAIDTTSAITLASTTVSFDPTMGWTRVILNGLSLVNGDSIAVYVETVGIQMCSFLIDGVQYEPSLTLNGGNLPTPYIDGDQLFGFWVGTAEESASYKLYQNQIAASGDIQFSGFASLLNQAAIFFLVNSDPASGPITVTGDIDLSGDAFTGLDGVVLSGGGTVVPTGLTVLLMFAGLDDFSTFTPADVDPAMALIGYNNAGIASGVNTSGSAGYTRPFATFSAPHSLLNSSDTKTWNKAAYFAVGYEFASIAASGAQNITHVQAELVPGTGANVVPSAYVRPRALTATLAPSQMNYITNPNFETDAAGWVAAPTTTISRQTSQHFLGSASLFSTGTGTQVGNYIAVPDLIVGEEYTVSAYALHTDGSNPRFLTMAVNPTVSLASAASATIAIVSTGWTQITLQFIAPTTNVIIGFWTENSLTAPTSTTMDWYLDAVMLNPGGLIPYGDGSFDGWNWEGTVNDSRSYYYIRGNIAYAAVQSVLSDHLALGLHAYAPVYNSPVTQFS